jgi:hypothetical protein
LDRALQGPIPDDWDDAVGWKRRHKPQADGIEAGICSGFDEVNGIGIEDRQRCEREQGHGHGGDFSTNKT